MSVGGHIIEMLTVRLESGHEAVRIRVMDRFDELFVYAEPWPDGLGPTLGEEVWWQGQKIFFNRDRNWLRKIGNSGDAYRPV